MFQAGPDLTASKMYNLLVLCPKIFKQKLTDLEQDDGKPSYPKPDSMRFDLCGYIPNCLPGSVWYQNLVYL